MVVDRDGDTIVAMRGDNASPHTMENARRKAYTAMTFKQPTAEYAKKLLDPTFSRPPAGDAAERDRHSGRSADQDRQ